MPSSRSPMWYSSRSTYLQHNLKPSLKPGTKLRWWRITWRWHPTVAAGVVAMAQASPVCRWMSALGTMTSLPLALNPPRSFTDHSFKVEEDGEQFEDATLLNALPSLNCCCHVPLLLNDPLRFVITARCLPLPLFRKAIRSLSMVSSERNCLYVMQQNGCSCLYSLSSLSLFLFLVKHEWKFSNIKWENVKMIKGVYAVTR